MVCSEERYHFAQPWNLIGQLMALNRSLESVGLGQLVQRWASAEATQNGKLAYCWLLQREDLSPNP